VRYVLTASLAGRDGTEAFSFSENRREGHAAREEARQRAIRAAESAAAGTGFAARFDAYLASLSP